MLGTHTGVTASNLPQERSGGGGGGKGLGEKVFDNNKVPGNWWDCLCNEGNKQELFWISLTEDCSFWLSQREGLCSSDINVLAKGSSHVMVPCNHKEADTRLLVHLHLVDALKNGRIYLHGAHGRYCRDSDHYWQDSSPINLKSFAFSRVLGLELG